MKKIIAIILSVAILIPCTVIAVDKGLFAVPEKKVTYEQAHQFADELKAMTGNADYRLIVSTDKEIEYMNAVSVAEGIEGLYVLQYNSLADAQKAEAYYNSLSYVNYVEYDKEEKLELCSYDSEYMPNNDSTAICNIDDALKLLNKMKNDLPEIKVGVSDTGVSLTNYNNNRLLGGYSFATESEKIGAVDQHGTKVAGVIIQNTPENVKIYSYQVVNDDGSAMTNSKIAASFYMEAADGCNIVNCSWAIGDGSNAVNESIEYATNQGVVIIAGSGNDGMNICRFPAKSNNVIGVGATTISNSVTTFSNYGKGVDIYAPGTGVQYSPNGTDFSGTSAATPIVSAICALILAADPNLKAQQIKEALVKTGNATNEDETIDCNRLVANAYASMKYLFDEELEQVQLDYTMSKNSNSIYTDISFNCEDNTSVYYKLKTGGNPEIPYMDQGNVLLQYKTDFKYENNTTVELSKYQIITACAYAPGKAKSKLQIFMAPIYYYDIGFLVNDGVISRCQLSDEIVEIPEYINDEQITEVGAYCFTGNKNIKTVILPDSVTRIDKYAFANCPNLETVIARGVDYTEHCAFYDCNKLKTVELPNLTIANTAMFKNCCSLSNLEIGTLDMICNQAFYCCENLQFLDVSDEVTSFCYNTFDNCNSLTVKVVEGSFMEEYANERGIPIGDLSYLRYDFAEDGHINAKDYARLIRNINGYENDLSHNYDINNDGIIDINDAREYKKNLGEVG